MGKVRTFLLLNYAGGAKQVYAGNDPAREARARRYYERAGWKVHKVRARTLSEATDVLERRLYSNRF